MYERIQKIIDDEKINPAEFARRIDASSGNVADWLKGRSRPGIDAIIRIHEVFNVSLDWLLKGEEDKTAEYIKELKETNERLVQAVMANDLVAVVEEVKRLRKKCIE